MHTCVSYPAVPRDRCRVANSSATLAAACRILLDTYSKSKYASIIQQNGGWQWFQRLLTTLNTIAKKHDSSIANVASRYAHPPPRPSSSF